MKKRFINPLLLLFFLIGVILLNTPDFSAAAAVSGSNESESSADESLKKTLRWENGKLYYYNAKGKKVKKRWKTINGKTYYFQKNGSAATGWTTIGGKRYRFTAKGVMKTGWFTKGSKTWYLAKKTGAMCTGWKKIGGKKYYFYSDGVMAKNVWIGKKYVGSDGVYDSTKKPEMTRLKSQLTTAIKSYSGTWSVYVKNLDTGEYISINNQKMYAASLIKLYAMGAAYERISQGKFSEASVSSLLNSMITVSSNDAFNSIVKKVGTTYINTWCKNNGYTQTNQGHGLSPSSNNSGLTNGSGSNVTSVKDCAAFLESVYNGKCVSKSASKSMLNYLKKQTRRSKIPAGVPGSVTVANKTGETNDYTHDAAIVYSKGATYIICVMAKASGRAYGVSGNITKLSKITYDFFN